MSSSVQIAPVAAVALQALADRLMRVCENPQQPTFNHFLFESVAALIRFGCEADPSMIAQFESSLFPAFEKVLQVRAPAQALVSGWQTPAGALIAQLLYSSHKALSKLVCKQPRSVISFVVLLALHERLVAPFKLSTCAGGCCTVTPCNQDPHDAQLSSGD
jgi:hypothetical protein